MMANIQQQMDQKTLEGEGKFADRRSGLERRWYFFFTNLNKRIAQRRKTMAIFLRVKNLH
jgi:hypothetical protein